MLQTTSTHHRLLLISLSFALLSCQTTTIPFPTSEKLIEGTSKDMQSKTSSSVSYPTTMANKQLALCASKEDIERLHGKTVRIEARYLVDPIPGGKKLQAAYLRLPDGTEVIRSYRPLPEEFVFVDKKVWAIGKIYRDANQEPYVQQVGGPHFFPDSIKLAPGETPYETIPNSLPSPPVAKILSSLSKRDGRWVLAQGTLLSLTPAPGNTTWASGKFRLLDGSELKLGTVSLAHWKSYVTKEVTIVGLVSMSKTDIPLLRNPSFCKGHVQQCDQRSAQ